MPTKMPDYNELIEVDPDESAAFDVLSGFVHREQIKGYKKKAAGLALSGGCSMAGIPLVGSIPSAISARKTSKHIKGLEEIKLKLNDPAGHNCTCRGCENILIYTIRQKKQKRAKKAISIVPVVGTVQTVGFKAKGAYKKFIKGNAGEKRQEVAIALWLAGGRIIPPCIAARAIVHELMGGKMQATFDAPTGYSALDKKLASG